MTSETCKVTIVELQENGIIRNDQGTIIGRLITTELLDDLKKSAKELNVVNKIKNTMREMRDAQGWSGNWNCDPYMHGLYNGMEYQLALLEGRNPEFREAPKRWLFVGANWGSFVSKVVDKVATRWNRYFGPKPICESTQRSDDEK